MPAPPVASQAAKDQLSKARSTRPTSPSRSTTTSVLPSGSSRNKGSDYYASSRVSNPSQALCRDHHLQAHDANTPSKLAQRDPSPTKSSQVKSATSNRGTVPDRSKAPSQGSENAPSSRRAEASNGGKARSQSCITFGASTITHSRSPDSKKSNGNTATSRAASKVNAGPRSATDQQQGSRARLSPTLASRQRSMTSVKESQQVASLKASGRQPQSQQEIPQPGLSQVKSNTGYENSGGQEKLKRKPQVSDRTITILKWFAYT